jgi:hypothetical protein
MTPHNLTDSRSVGQARLAESAAPRHETPRAKLDRAGSLGYRLPVAERPSSEPPRSAAQAASGTSARRTGCSRS